MELQRRHVQLLGSSNLRDIGGYGAAGGMRVRWGRVFRSGSLWGLKEADWEWIDQQVIAVVCDLRSDAEREVAPTRWGGRTEPQQVDQSYDAAFLFGRRTAETSAGVGGLEADLYVQFARLLAPSFRGLFQALQNGNAPAIVHCTAGQDRTGLAVALLLGALGVNREAIYADYLLSPELRRPENEIDRGSLLALAESNVVAAYYTDLLARHGPEVFIPRPLIDASGQPLVDIALAAIEREWGGVDCYLEAELGVGPAEIARLREHLLEPA